MSLLYPVEGPEGGFLVLRRDLARDLFAAADRRVFDAFDGDGRFRGRIVAPVSFSPRLVTSTTLVGAITDELGVPYVVRYRLVRS